MKTAVAITLIVSGVVLVAIPPLSDAWHALMATRLLEHGANSVTLSGRMEDMYRFGCWLLGAVMIAVGVLASLAPALQGDRVRAVPAAG